MEDGKITHRNRRLIRKWHLSDTKPPNLKADDDGESKPPNLKADDDGEFFGWDDDGKEITNQNGVDLSKKRSNRLAGKQKVDYRLLNGV